MATLIPVDDLDLDDEDDEEEEEDSLEDTRKPTHNYNQFVVGAKGGDTPKKPGSTGEAKTPEVAPGGVTKKKGKGFRFFSALKNFIFGANEIGRRRRLGLVALLVLISAVVGGSQVNFKSLTRRAQAKTSAPVTAVAGTPAADAAPTALPANVNMLANFAATKNSNDVAHARDTAGTFAEGLWTYDYRHPAEYVNRLAPFCDSALMPDIRAMSTAPDSLSQQLVQSAFARMVDLTVDPAGTAHATVTLDVEVFRKSRTISPTDTNKVVPGGASSSSGKDQSSLRSGYESFNASTTITLNMVVRDYEWQVTSYDLAENK